MSSRPGGPALAGWLATQPQHWRDATLESLEPVAAIAGRFSFGASDAHTHDHRRGMMEITRNGTGTQLGPTEWFTGTVYIDAVAAPSHGVRVSAASVHFTPGARTAWHTHPNGQTIYVTEGVGLVQRRGGPVEVIRPGDRVFFEPGEDHWHGAAPTRFMTHLAIHEVGEDGGPATWGEHVTDEEYGAAPPVDG